MITISSHIFPVALMVNNSPANAGDARDKGLIHELGRFPGVGNGNPSHYSFLENSTHTEEAGGLLSMGLQRIRHD